MRDFDDVFHSVVSGNPYSMEGVTNLSTYQKRNRISAGREVTYFTRTRDERLDDDWDEAVAAFDFVD